MKVDVRQSSLQDPGAALVAVGLYEGDSLPAEVAGAPGAADAKGSFKTMTRLYPGGGPERLLVVGLGERNAFDVEKLRVLAALVAGEAAKVEATSLAWALPEYEDEAAAAEAIVTGTILGAYRFDRFKGEREEDGEKPRLSSLTVLGPAELAGAAETARVYSEAANRARNLQETPANFAKPEDLAARAEEIAAGLDKVTVEVLDGDAIRAKGMGGLAAVSQGGPVDPRLIVLRYAGGGDGPTLGFVGKGVTFDTGGISLKPGAGMAEMKFDMSGAAAVLEGFAAIAELGLPVDLIAVVPSTENMPSGTAVKPGDVITQYNGKTVEVNNTDAEGRLILADALAYAVEQGAERVVDLATLTGAV
ncbi:MAG: leucyl aminopeptidase, partial [Actinobacteria bacterium]|nr:leucyl aminopeptidase [Actinomycetota bacterium]